jgi:crotonobetainyl-CoA:carnitine CoA-transferase CaiB-like acyl-CoA transferase
VSCTKRRDRTGEGQYIDLSQWETTMAVLPEGIMDAVMNGDGPERDGNRDPHMAPHGIFRAAGNERWIALAIRNDDEWRRLALLMNRPDAADDARFATLAARKANEDALEDLVRAWMAAHDAAEVTALLQGAGRAAPCLGEATDYVLGEILGRDTVTIADLRARGIVA